MEEVNLETGKISKLLRKFAIPSIIALVVNALYNIVDQIFIGWGVNYLANGATNVVFPITIVGFAFALMFGDGTAAFLSLKLGERKEKEAEKGIVNGIFISIITSIILCTIALIFLPSIINIFGCTDALREYALSYGRIVVIGLPFVMIGLTLNPIIRADGSPKYAMASMIAGAILNTILDAIAIFVFKWGIAGAALATVIGQFVTFLANVIYIKKIKSVKLTKESLKINVKTIKTVSMLGISSFITQTAIVIVIAVQNTLFKVYGADSKFGAEIPITVLGIVMKINQILNSIVIGIATGSQPIIGFNYGARKFDRVKEALKIVLTLCFTVALIAFTLFQTIPEKLISIFGSGDVLYNEFACITFRTYLMLVIFNAIQIATGIFFQAIGKPTKSAFITLSRQILFFIPSCFILSKLFGVMGVIYSAPVADLVAFLVTASLLAFEMKNLKKAENKSYNISKDLDEKASEKSRDLIITISREYGSGGRYIGELLAKKLNLKLYDKNLIEIVSNKSGLSASYIEENEQNIHGSLLSNFNAQYYNNLSNDDNLFIAESKAIKEIAEKGDCIIIGRCADFILSENKNVVKIFLYSDDENKIKRAVKYYGLDEKNALNEINKINKAREKHYNYYTGNKWKDLNNYDIAINVDKYGVEKSAEILSQFIEKSNYIYER